MTHLDRDTLALVALAELELSAAEREHLVDCPGCTGELDALRRTVLIGRSAGSVDLVEPADAVWGRIHAALGLTDTVAAPPRLAAAAAAAPVDTVSAQSAAPGAPPEALPTPEHPTVHSPAPGTPAAGPRPPGTPANAPRPPGAPPAGFSGQGGPTAAAASVVSLAPRRSRRHRSRAAWLPVAAAACAVGLIGGIAGGAWWQSTRTPAPSPVVYEAQLDALPGWSASGSAAVEESADGRRDVVVDLLGDAGDDGLREVWLLTPDATGLVSVGLLDGSTGRFAIPAGIDLTEFSVVDVSAEPADGNPAHSGDSIVRGSLHGL